MKQYSNKGPVMEFDRCIANVWEGTTWAVSPSKARCNLAYQYKREHGKVARTRITLPGDIVLVEGKDDGK